MQTGVSQWTKPDEPYVPYDEEAEGYEDHQQDRLETLMEGAEDEALLDGSHRLHGTGKVEGGSRVSNPSPVASDGQHSNRSRASSSGSRGSRILTLFRRRSKDKLEDDGSVGGGELSPNACMPFFNGSRSRINSKAEERQRSSSSLSLSGSGDRRQSDASGSKFESY